MSNSNSLVFTPPEEPALPNNTIDTALIVSHAYGLSSSQQQRVVSAFQSHAYDMSAEYVWRRAMIKLRSSLESLGMSFIGEMLGDESIDEYSNIESVLTDYRTINLAENLGAVTSTGALKLRHSLETLNHYLSEKAQHENEELSAADALQIIFACVKYILSHTEVSVALEFYSLRDKLLRETIDRNDSQLDAVYGSHPFYLRTVLSILINAIKSDKGATLDHALSNLNTLIEGIWMKLPEKDKWLLGEAYTDVTAAGNLRSIKGMKSALLKVKGFDYVPENLRSITFKKAAQAVIDAHFSSNNFYTEPPLIKQLADLGTVIPLPAFIDCVQAYLSVYIGNSWGYSYNAQTQTKEQLKKIGFERWVYYFSKVIQSDEIILAKLLIRSPIKRMTEFMQENLEGLEENDELIGDNRGLVRALMLGNSSKVTGIAGKLYQQLTTSDS